VELAGVEEEELLLESDEDDVELSPVDFVVVSDLVSEVDLESDEDELSLLELPLLSTGGLGRP